jgi:fructuronate reductase
VGTGSDPVAVASGLLGVQEVFGDDLRDSAVLRDALVRHLKDLL